MYLLLFKPSNDSARSTFSQLVCARKMSAAVFAQAAEEIRPVQDALAGRLRQLIIRLEEEGGLIGKIAHDCAFAQLSPAVESKNGRVVARVPAADLEHAHRIGSQLLSRFKAASLGRGSWTFEAQPVAGQWGIANAQRDYFSWRITLPLGRPMLRTSFVPAEIEDGLHDALYGALLAQASITHGRSHAPYPGALHVALDGVQEIHEGPAEGLVDLHEVRFNANISGGNKLFVGLDLMGGSGLIQSAKRK